MTILALGSMFLTALGFVTGWLQSRGSIHGWYLALISQGFWAVYALTTHQWGFVFGVATGVIIAANGIRNFRGKQLTLTHG